MFIRKAVAVLQITSILSNYQPFNSDLVNRLTMTYKLMKALCLTLVLATSVAAASSENVQICKESKAHKKHLQTHSILSELKTSTPAHMPTPSTRRPMPATMPDSSQSPLGKMPGNFARLMVVTWLLLGIERRTPSSKVL